MDTGLKGKVALVCAASQGLGRASAMAMAREGARVAICARGEAALEEAAAAIRSGGGDTLAVAADLTRGEDIVRVVDRTVAAFGGLDILVTNAGGPTSGTFDTLTEADWRAAIDLTLMSVVRLCMAVVPHMRRRGGGRIIHVTSITVKEPVAGLMLSNALRAAVTGFSKTLATELAPDGILVNCVAPGYTRTDRVIEVNAATARREGVEPAEVERRLVSRIPLGRLGEAAEFGDVVTFLASDRASYVTGVTLQVDGGIVRSMV